MHQDLLQLQACQNPFDDQKHKSQDHNISESSLIVASGYIDQKLPISRENAFEPYSSSGHKKYEQPRAKSQLFQNDPHMRKDVSI